MNEVTLDLKITRSQQPLENEYNINFEVVESTNIPKEIFLFHVQLDSTAEFHNVCSTSDLSEFPPDEAMDGIPFFRLASANFVFDSLDGAEEYLNRIRFHVDCLVKNFQKSLNYVESEVIESYPLPTAPLEEI